MKKFSRFLVILCLLLSLSIAGMIGFCNWAKQSPDSGSTTDESYVFQIERGESLISIATRLEKDNRIRSALFLRLYSRFKKTENLFKAGSFRLSQNMDLLSVHDALVYGEELRAKVVIPEGWTLRRIALYMEDKGLVTRDEFIQAASDPEILTDFSIPAKTAEGYLFPDTYSFPEGLPARDMVTAMISNFFTRIGQIYPDYKTLSPEDFHQKVIVASIVEKEYRIDTEAPLMASVFYNRLRINIHLQSCATVIYTITDVLKRPHPDRLFHDDLQIDSRYNTYKYLGLPKGPISNPGSVALKAAFFPADTSYFFFVLEDPSIGSHTFTTYLDEHIEAKYQNKHLYR